MYGDGAGRITYADGSEALFTGHAARVWDVGTGKEIAVLRGHTDRVVSAAFSPDGGKIVTASDDKTARVWDVVTGKQLALLEGDAYSLASAAFSPDGQRVLTVSAGTVNSSGFSDNKPLPKDIDPLLPAKKITDAKGIGGGKSGGGRTMGSNFPDGPARLWDANTGKQIAVLEQDPKNKNHPRDYTMAAAFSPDGSRIVTGYHGHYADAEEYIHDFIFWDGRTGKRLSNIERRHPGIRPNP